MHVLITRPESDAAALRGELEALGHTVSVEPLLTIRALPVSADAVEGIAALVATSRNGLRALAESPAFDAAKQLPLIAVGPGTAGLAQEIGFTRVTAGKGTGVDLVPAIVATARELGGPVAHVRGKDVAFDLREAVQGQGLDLREIVSYEAVAADRFQPATRDLIASGVVNAVILMSPRTGSTFSKLARTEGLSKAAQNLGFLCLSPAVAATVEPLGPARVEIAESPDVAAMLAAVTRVATLWSGV
jgi:uroporphyrinogen-III synthase